MTPTDLLKKLEKRFDKLEALLKDQGPEKTRGAVIGFAVDNGIPIEAADEFFDKMEEVGWTKNKGKTPIKDWRATLRIWHKKGWLQQEKPQRRPGRVQL